MSDGHPSFNDGPYSNQPSGGYSTQRDLQSAPPGQMSGAISSGGTSLNVVIATLGRNTLIALAGALVTLIAFFVLPYFSGSVVATSVIVTPVVEALCGPNGCTYAFTAAQVVSQDAVVLLVPLLALLAAGLLTLAALRPPSIPALTPRNSTLGAAVGAALALLVLVIQLSMAQALINGTAPVAGLLREIAGVRVEAGMSFGFWFMVLGVLTVLAGAVLELVRLSPQAAAQKTL